MSPVVVNHHECDRHRLWPAPSPLLYAPPVVPPCPLSHPPAALDKHPLLQFAFLRQYLRSAGVLFDSANDGHDASLLAVVGGGGGAPVGGAGGSGGGGGGPGSVSPDIHLRFISLLCTYEPRNVLPYLNGSSGLTQGKWEGGGVSSS